MNATRLPKPKVSDTIIFRPTPSNPELVVRPCSGKHRDYWLSGYIVLSCRKCIATLEPLEGDVTADRESSDISTGQSNGS